MKPIKTFLAFTLLLLTLVILPSTLTAILISYVVRLFVAILYGLFLGVFFSSLAFFGLNDKSNPLYSKAQVVRDELKSLISDL
jgi:type IV secretory pathway TrbD component